MVLNPAENLPALQSSPLQAQLQGVQSFQDPTGPQIAQLGQGLLGAARVASQLQDRIDETQAREKLLELGKMQSELLMAPESGYLWQQGVNALQGRPAVLDQFGGRMQELEDSLQTNQAKKMFRQVAGLRQLELQQRVDAHAGREAVEYDTQTAAAAIDQYANEAIDAYGLPGISITQQGPDGRPTTVGGDVNQTFNIRRDQAIGEFQRLAKLRGLPEGSAAYNDLKRRVTGKIDVGVTEKLLQQDPAKAYRYLRNLGDDSLDPNVRRDLMAKVSERADYAIGVKTASDLLERYKDPALAQAGLQALYDGGAISPQAFVRAGNQIDEARTRMKAQMDVAKVQSMDVAKRIANAMGPGATFEALPKEVQAALEGTYQVAEFQDWATSDRRDRSNPIKVVELTRKDRAWWRDQTQEGFLAQYGNHLSSGDKIKFLELVGVGPKVEQTMDAKDLDRTAAFEFGILDKSETFADQEPEDLLKFSQFQRRVDQIYATIQDVPDPADRRDRARKMALMEKAQDKTYRWEKPESMDEPTSVVGVGDQQVDVNQATKMEFDQATAELAQENQVDLTRHRARIEAQVNIDPTVPINRREGEVERRLKEVKIAQLTPDAIGGRISAIRQKKFAQREAERKVTPGYVSWATLERQGLVQSRAAELDRVARGQSLIATDDLQIQDVKPGRPVGTDQLERVFESTAVSAAAVQRMLAAAPKSAQKPTVMSQQQRKEALQRWDVAVKDAAALQESKVKRSRAGNAEAMAAIEAQLQSMPSEDPRLRALRATLAVAQAGMPEATMAEAAQQAWEAWLQSGGDEWEGWYRSGAPRDEAPSVVTRQPTPYGTLTTGRITWEEHEAMRKSVERYVPAAQRKR
jgi:hypothetical protein